MHSSARGNRAWKYSTRIWDLNNIVVPLMLLIFKHWNELKIGDIWQVVFGLSRI